MMSTRVGAAHICVTNPCGRGQKRHSQTLRNYQED